MFKFNENSGDLPNFRETWHLWNMYQDMSRQTKCSWSGIQILQLTVLGYSPQSISVNILILHEQNTGKYQ